MSVQAISAALAVQDISPSEKFLLVVLANYADQNMVCWPSQERLAHDLCISPRTIIRLFKGLETAGLIARKERNRRADGSRTSHIIKLYLHGDNLAGRPTSHSAKLAPDMVTNGASHSAKLAPYPSLEELKEEPSGEARSPHECDALRDEVDSFADYAAERKAVGAMMKELAASMKGRRS